VTTTTSLRSRQERAREIVEGDRLIRERRRSGAIAAGCGLGGLARLALGVENQDIARLFAAIAGLLFVAMAALFVGGARGGDRQCSSTSAGPRRASGGAWERTLRLQRRRAGEGTSFDERRGVLNVTGPV
jgi:hypothetical protein